MLEDVDRKRLYLVYNEIEAKINKYKNGYTKSHMLFEALQKDKETWEEKLKK